MRIDRGIWGKSALATLQDRERSREKNQGGGQTGNCQGYGSREDSKNSGRVLPVKEVMLRQEESRLAEQLGNWYGV